jgi:archaemetzincin
MKRIWWATLVMCCMTASCTGPEGAPDVVDPLVILVQPLGEVPVAQLDSVRSALMKVYYARVFMAAPRDLPPRAFTAVRTPRYRADTVIAWLRGEKPDSVDLILGITAQDISITKYDAFGAIKEPKGKYRDFGIFGLGYIGGPSCVVSTFRLGDGGSPVFFDRLMKITVHELGHNRRLPHCPDPRCVMRDAVERMSSIDAAGRTLCARCAGSIGSSH